MVWRCREQQKAQREQDALLEEEASSASMNGLRSLSREHSFSMGSEPTTPNTPNTPNRSGLSRWKSARTHLVEYMDTRSWISQIEERVPPPPPPKPVVIKQEEEDGEDREESGQGSCNDKPGTRSQFQLLRFRCLQWPLLKQKHARVRLMTSWYGRNKTQNRTYQTRHQSYSCMFLL